MAKPIAKQVLQTSAGELARAWMEVAKESFSCFQIQKPKPKNLSENQSENRKENPMENPTEEANDKFLFFEGYYKAAKELPPKRQLAFYEAVMAYAFYGKPLPTDGPEAALYVLIKHSIDESIELSEMGRKGGKSRSEAKKTSARANGKLGGRPPKTQKPKPKPKPKPNETQAGKPNEKPNENQTAEKKENGKEKHSPHIPYKEKGEEKETHTHQTRVRACARARARRWFRSRRNATLPPPRCTTCCASAPTTAARIPAA